MNVEFAQPGPADYEILFGKPIYSEVLRVAGEPQAMAVLVTKPDGRVFAWTSFRNDVELTHEVGRLAVLAMRRVLRQFRSLNPGVPVHSGADERGYPQVGRMLKALGFVPTDEHQRENMNRVWVWLP